MLDNTVITQILRIMTVHAEKEKFYRQGNRESYGLSLCAGGQITYTMDGRQTVSQPGYAILLPQGSSYVLHGDKPGLFPLVNFHCQGLKLEGITALPLADPGACMADFSRLSSLYQSGASQLQLLSAFYSLLAKLPDRSPPTQLSPAIGCIMENLSDPAINNTFLARQLGISEVYLRKLFVQHYHTTPKQFILDKRIAKAKQLLLDTSMTVSAISESCGFSSVYHFCRAFKEKTGTTPTCYAKGNRVYRL